MIEGFQKTQNQMQAYIDMLEKSIILMIESQEESDKQKKGTRKYEEIKKPN